ncbi:hypothetical protein BWQ93_05925 [Sphingopyxis sp. QXT-31]|uniref:hypothetical protein n=1 Tax=Sphingopyxis sp. QXT-31 TaxID=1357916 RepID=UPI000979255D|nr:hypothetical protein [Sphingopyxis sp. QXT-31]APZ98068.1 hypothetical protein BWQ93_05925 [Sphingopyxis sp. QXT-31]
MTDSPKKRAFIIASFNDNGTGESFTAGETPLIDAGAYGNYEAAGLVGTPPVASKPAKAKAAPKKAAKPKAKPAARTPSPAPAPTPAPAPVTAPEPVADAADGGADA